MVPASRPKRRSRAKIDNRKRAIYVEQACNLCKARKTKCDGKFPCENCERRSLECQYAKVPREDQLEGEQSREPGRSSISTEPASIGLTELTELVSALQKKVALLERQKPDPEDDPAEEGDDWVDEEVDGQGADNVSQVASAGSPMFAGPTSSSFSLGMAKIILERDPNAKTSSAQHAEATSSASFWEEVEEDEPAEQSRDLMMTAPAPMHGLQLRDALRLLQVYHECVGVLHPILDIESLVQQSQALWQPTHEMNPQRASSSASADVDDDHLCMALAIALLAEGGGSNKTAAGIHRDLQPAVAKQMMAKNFTLRGQILLLLESFYQVFQDDHRLASRYIAIACRLMVEAGLHQRQILLQRFPRSNERNKALTILSTCLILDRQLNFNAGLPFTLKESDVDIAEMGTLPPYVKAMAAYARIGPPAWAAVTDDKGKLRPRIRDEDFDYLDYQVRCWQDNLPTELQPNQSARMESSPGSGRETATDRPTLFLRYILYLRANQFKVVILRPLLFSAQTVRLNLKRVKVLADISKDTIQTIADMNVSHDLYRKQQPILNVFLSSALSTLLLIYIHGLRDPAKSPDQQVSSGDIAREGINKALELMRTYSGSRSSQRLWKKYAGRKGILSRLGFQQPDIQGSEITPSLSDSSSPTVPTVFSDKQYSDPGLATTWTNIPHQNYPPVEGLEMFNNNHFQQGLPVEGVPPLPMFDMGQFFIPGDVGFMFDDAW